jgi:hypothetical protein
MQEARLNVKQIRGLRCFLSHVDFGNPLKLRIKVDICLR